jgi:DnaJ-class molecular chaperone
MSREDHYTVLGLTPPVGSAEIRRAYRLLALRHHPDRAGPDATATFQRIAEAYRVLSDPGLRSTYDATPEARQGATHGATRDARRGAATSASPFRPYASPIAPGAGAAEPLRSTTTLIPRLCDTLDALEARRIARVHTSGLIDLHVTADEARGGGVAAISLPLTIPCPTCGGIAAPDSVWCRRCQFAGSVVEEVTLCVPIPAHARDGMTFNLELERLGDLPPMAVRLRVA